MNFSTLHTEPEELQISRTGESEETLENLANRNYARLEATLAVAGMNGLREQKNAERLAKLSADSTPSSSPPSSGR